MTEREKLIELIIASVDGCAEYWASRIADYLLANGVRLPVQCKECKRCDIKEYGKSGKWCKLTTLPILQRNHYCSYGERRADNDRT